MLDGIYHCHKIVGPTYKSPQPFIHSWTQFVLLKYDDNDTKVFCDAVWSNHIEIEFTHLRQHSTRLKGVITQIPISYGDKLSLAFSSFLWIFIFLFTN